MSHKKSYFTKLLLWLLVAVMLFSNTAFAVEATVDPSFLGQNDIYFYDPSASNDCSQGVVSVGLSGSSNEAKAYNFFISKGLSSVQAAGAAGNMSIENSAFDPTVVQGGGHTDDPSSLTSGGHAYGLIQWDPGAKLINLFKQANISDPINSLSGQLNMIWWHIENTTPTGKKGFLQKYKQINDVTEAANTWQSDIEGTSHAKLDREAAAQLAYKKYSGSAPTSSSDNLGSTQGSTDPSTVCCPSSTNNSPSQNTNSSADTATGSVDVVLDPGHTAAPSVQQPKYSSQGLQIGETANGSESKGELKDMWDTAQQIKSKLESDGYSVKLTKDSINDTVTLEDRAKKADSYNGQLVVSLHSTPGTFGSKSSGWVATQKVGLYRTTKSGKKIVFNNTDVANKSQQYGGAVVAARKVSEGDAQLHDIDFTGRSDKSPGNIPIVMLLSKTPWIYNEVGQTGFNKDKYAAGLVKGIESVIKPGANPSASSGSSDTCGGSGSGAVNGSVIQTALNYAWPTYHAPNYLNLKPPYAKAVANAQQKGKYVGGGPHPGVDCGGFVTRVMQDSGVDPNYGGGGATQTQYSYMLSHPRLYKEVHPKSTADMQPGDIAIKPSEHTYLYVGTQPNFQKKIASASYSPSNTAWRSPMAGSEAPADPSYHWFRYIGGSNS